jgi:hypothetical protein
VSRGVDVSKENPMNKSTLIKWVVAAVLAIPAIPTFAQTVRHHHKLTKSTRTHRVLTATGRRHHVYHTTKRHTSTLVTHRHGVKKLSHRSVRRTSLSSKTGSQGQVRVHFTKMPPTIDGINA